MQAFFQSVYIKAPRNEQTFQAGRVHGKNQKGTADPLGSYYSMISVIEKR